MGMLQEGEVRRSQGLSFLMRGSKKAACLNSCPLRALGVLAQQRRCGVGTAEPLGPCREPMVPDWLAA